MEHHSRRNWRVFGWDLNLPVGVFILCGFQAWLPSALSSKKVIYQNWWKNHEKSRGDAGSLWNWCCFAMFLPRNFPCSSNGFANRPVAQLLRAKGGHRVERAVGDHRQTDTGSLLCDWLGCTQRLFFLVLYTSTPMHAHTHMYIYSNYIFLYLVILKYIFVHLYK